jgi:hypothetical protein
MQNEKHTTEIMNSQSVELSKMKSEIKRTIEQSEREAMGEADARCTFPARMLRIALQL